MIIIDKTNKNFLNNSYNTIQLSKNFLDNKKTFNEILLLMDIYQFDIIIPYSTELLNNIIESNTNTCIIDFSNNNDFKKYKYIYVIKNYADIFNIKDRYLFYGDSVKYEYIFKKELKNGNTIQIIRDKDDNLVYLESFDKNNQLNYSLKLC